MRSKKSLTISVVFFLSCTTFAVAQTDNQGITPTSITIGTSTPLTGPVAPNCKPVSDGSLAWFEHVNANGGVNGRKINNIVLDDAFKAPEAMANGRELAAKPVFAIFAGCGTMQPPVLLPTIEKSGLLYIFPWAAEPDLSRNKLAYSLVPRFKNQFVGLLTAALKRFGTGSVFVIYSSAPGVEEATEALKQATVAAGATHLGTEVVNMQEADYTTLMLKIKNLKPDYIVMHSTTASMARMLKAMDANDAYPKKYLLGASSMSESRFLENVGNLVNGRLLTVLAVLPESSDRSKACLDAIKKSVPELKPDVFSLWGCAAAQAFVTALQETPEPVTRERMAKTLESWKDKQVSPLLPPVTFTPDNHLGLNTMIMAETKNGTPVGIGTLEIAR